MLLCFTEWTEFRINRIHERAFKLIYPNQNQLKFKELLEKNKTVNVRERNLETFAAEIYKAKNYNRVQNILGIY